MKAIKAKVHPTGLLIIGRGDAPHVGFVGREAVRLTPDVIAGCFTCSYVTLTPASRARLVRLFDRVIFAELERVYRAGDNWEGRR